MTICGGRHNASAKVFRVNQPTAASGSAPPPTARASHTRWIRWGVLLGVAAFVGLFLVTDLKELWRTLTKTDPWWLSLPILSALASYGAMTLSYQGIAKAAGVPISFWEMFKITLVANTANYLVSSGGLSGFATRMYFLARRDIRSGTAVVISLAQTFLTNVTLLLFVLAGFLFLFQAQTLQGRALVVSSLLLGLSCIAAVLAALLLFQARLRRRTLFVLSLAAHRLLHRVIPHRTPARTHIWRYQRNLNRGIEFLISRKRDMVLPSLYILLDWFFTLLILYTAFRALHYPIRPSVIIVGFAVGIIFSFVSPIPSGLGVMEGSMAAAFASFDVPFETAVVAVLLFRLAYYVLPVAISLFFFHGMFVQSTHLSDAELEASALASCDAP